MLARSITATVLVSLFVALTGCSELRRALDLGPSQAVLDENARIEVPSRWTQVGFTTPNSDDIGIWVYEAPEAREDGETIADWISERAAEISLPDGYSEFREGDRRLGFSLLADGPDCVVRIAEVEGTADSRVERLVEDKGYSGREGGLLDLTVGCPRDP